MESIHGGYEEHNGIAKETYKCNKANVEKTDGDHPW